MQRAELIIGDVLTYHKRSPSLISYFSDKFWRHQDKAKAPSHVLICIGKDDQGEPRFAEADWGKGVFLMPWIRRNSGVRLVSWAKLQERNGWHCVWRVPSGIERAARKRIQRYALTKAAERTRYDFIGLVSAAIDTIKLDRMTSFHDPRAFFCSEFVGQCLWGVAGVRQTANTKPLHRISPAMLPEQWGMNFVDFLPEK